MGSRFKKNRARTHLVNALKRKVLESKIRKSDGDPRLVKPFKK